MPIFKFGDATVVDRSADGDLSLPAISVYGLMQAEGFITIPLLSIYGKTQDVVNADITISAINIDGFIGISAAVVGDIDIPALSVNGHTMAECSIELFPIGVLGVAVSDGFCVGSISLPHIQIAGDTTQQVVVDGEVTIPVIMLHGMASVLTMAAASADINMPAMRIIGLVINADAQASEGQDRIVNYAHTRRYI